MGCNSYICDLNQTDALPADRQMGNAADLEVCASDAFGAGCRTDGNRFKSKSKNSENS
jgi:hypothetical protein